MFYVLTGFVGKKEGFDGFASVSLHMNNHMTRHDVPLQRVPDDTKSREKGSSVDVFYVLSGFVCKLEGFDGLDKAKCTEYNRNLPLFGCNSFSSYNRIIQDSRAKTSKYWKNHMLKPIRCLKIDLHHTHLLELML